MVPTQYCDMESDLFILRYLGVLVGVFVASTIKTLVFRLAYGMDMNDIFCIELAIAIILAQIYLFYERRYVGSGQTHILVVILVNILMVTIAWMFGTTTGLKCLYSNPNIYH